METSYIETKWLIKSAPIEVIDSIVKHFGCSKVTADILAQRVENPTIENIRMYLAPSLKNLLAPSLMDEMDKAVNRLIEAIDKKQRIVIYGDYDTDGVTSCALLIRIFRALGHKVSHKLPSRQEDGYGISEEFVKKAIKDQISVVVTVDCGTSEHEKIKKLAAAGIDVIITDHHEPGDNLLPPSAFAVLNPKRNNGKYPFRELTGVGVAFKLAWALCEKISKNEKTIPLKLKDTLLSLLPIVAIGTIADVAPLIGENRVIVALGLRMMQHSFPGITALLEVCRLIDSEISTRSIAFSLSPRLNAAGRLGNAELALKLLVEDDLLKARKLAGELDKKNIERQNLCQVILEEAVAEVKKTHDLANDKALVVGRINWHEGVIGIVAGRLSEMFAKPTAVIALTSNNKGKGSARGIQGLNLFEALNKTKKHLLTFGGHEQAAGFSINEQEIESFRHIFKQECKLQIEERKLIPTLAIDAEITLQEINNKIVAELDKLKPFGTGNPEPKFLIKNIKISGSPKLMGSQLQHFHFNLIQNGIAYRAVVFNNRQLLNIIEKNKNNNWDVVFTLSLNTYYTPARLELKVEDMRPTSSTNS